MLGFARIGKKLVQNACVSVESEEISNIEQPYCTSARTGVMSPLQLHLRTVGSNRLMWPSHVCL